jgi:hypothetical protein
MATLQAMWTDVTTVAWADIVARINVIAMWFAALLDIERTSRGTWFGAKVSTPFDQQRFMEARLRPVDETPRRELGEAFARRIDSIVGYGADRVIVLDVVPHRARAPPASICTGATTTTNEMRWRRDVERTHDG